MLRSICAVSFLALGLGLGSPAAAQLSWTVVESSPSALELIVEVQGARLTEAGANEQGRSWSLVELVGAHQTGEPGLPLLPRAAKWLALPPSDEARMRFEILDRELLGTAHLAPHPFASIDERAMRDEPRLMERAVEGPNYPLFRSDDAAVVRLGAPVFQRRQRMAPLECSPVIYDAASGRVQVVTKLRVRVEFPASAPSADEIGRRVTPVSGGLLNPVVAQGWQCLSPALAQRQRAWSDHDLRALAKVPGTPVFDAAALQSAEVRLRVAETGLHRVRMSVLIDQFQLPLTTLRKDLRLYQKRRSDLGSPAYPQPITADVPLHLLGNPDENAVIDREDVIVFYGLSAQDDHASRTVDGTDFPAAMPERMRPDNFNSANVYWLAAMDPAAGSWTRMATEQLGVSQGNPEPHFRRVRTFAGDVAYRPDGIDATVERYFWNDWDEVAVLRTLPISAAVQDSSVRLNWSVAGSGRFFNTGTPRPVDFFLEGNSGRIPLGSINSDQSFYRVATELNASVAASQLDDGFVSFGMESLSNGVPGRVGAYLSWVKVDYASEYRASFSDMDFTAGRASLDVDLEVGGFTRSDLLLFDISDPHAPRAIDVAPNVIDQLDGTFQLSVRVPQTTGQLRRFRATPLSRIDELRNQDLELDPVATVFDTADDLQVLAVGPDFLAGTMQGWVEWRTTHDIGYGWKVGYVDVQQIYDDFSGGLQSPQAIHDFVEYAYTMWGAQALLLVGDANEDARGVGADAGVNLVPTKLHLQVLGAVYELLGSDKWYGFLEPADSYPNGIAKTSDLLVGRLPVADAEGLQVMLDKIYAYEKPALNDDWRGRSYWVADDAYSSDLLGAAVGSYRYVSSEEGFGVSQNNAAQSAATSLDSLQQGIYYNVDEVTSGCRSDVCPTVTAGCVAGCFANRGQARLMEVLSQGWMVVSYQGHAAFNRLAHETILNRNGLTNLENFGRPFLFFGMGCHVSDFLQPNEGRVLSPIGEYIVMIPQRGAIASYGSNGFEYLRPNAAFMEEIASTIWTDGRPVGMVGGGLRSQWILGEVLAQAELNILGTPGVSLKDKMVAQYNLLGDPLLRMDALPPRLHVRLPRGVVSDGEELVADVGSATASFTVDAVDETGVSHLDILDSEGRDSSGLLQDVAGTDPRRRAMTLSLPVLPQTYDVEFHLYDGAYPETRPTTLTLHVVLQTEMFVEDSPFDPSAGEGLPVGQSRRVELRLTSPVDLSPTDIEGVTLVGGTVGPVTATGSGRQWTLRFDATAESPTGQALQLALAGVVEEIPLSAGPEGGGLLAIERHYPYPNPARMSGGQPISVVARASEALQWARLTVFDLSGRLVYEGREDGADVAGPDFSMQWDGRSPDGSEVANGTYFYRLEVGAGTRTARSDMGRIVVMR